MSGVVRAGMSSGHESRCRRALAKSDATARPEEYSRCRPQPCRGSGLGRFHEPQVYQVKTPQPDRIKDRARPLRRA
jgi:hypothetical protein